MNELIKEAINTALNNPRDWRIALLVIVVLVVIGLFTGYLQKIIDWIFVKIVGRSKTQSVNASTPTIVIRPDGFTHNTGRLYLIFENTGDATVIIQGLKIGENNVDIDEFSLGPGQKIRKQLNVSGFKILEEKLGSPNFELLYKDFSNNKKYKTVGNISQESRADGKYNLGKISEISFLAINQDSSTSNLEKRVLEKLYSDYKRTGQKTKWKATDAFQELGIKDGQDVSTLHDSKFIKIELYGTHECLVITSEGIRYMDNLSKT